MRSAHLDPLGLAELVAELDRHVPEMRRARVEHLVNAVADAHDLLLLRERVLDPGDPPCPRGRFPASMWMTPSFAPPCSGPLSVPMAALTAEYMSAQRRDDDARGEGGRVEAVLGVQHVGDVERLLASLRGLLAVDQVEEMRGLAQVLADRAAAPGPGGRGGNRRR